MINPCIVIVTFNALPYIQECLDSCKGSNIVVVDNASTDKTVTYIQTNFPHVQLFPQKQNLGFGQANNLGIRFALNNGADYVFLLNQDAYLEEGCLETLLEAHRQNPNYGILSPIHLNGEGNKLDKNFSHYVSYNNNEDFYSDFILKKPLQDIYEVSFVNAAGWLLSKDILQTVGGFDPIFFHYGEDDNYCQRALYHDFKIGVVPTAFLRHDRESRIDSRIEIGSKKYFAKMERALKTKFANINVDNTNELCQLLKKRKASKLKAGLKFKFSQLRLLEKEVKLLKKVTPEIQKSRDLNQQKKANYLN